MVACELEGTKNERILSVSFLLTLPLMFGATLYVIYLRSVNVVGSDTDFVFLLIPIILGCIIVFLGIYEVSYSYQIERKPAYQIKRFLLRSSLTALYLSFALGLWSAMQFYLLPFLYWKYSLILSFFVATMLLVIIVVKIPRIRDAMAKLEKGV